MKTLGLGLILGLLMVLFASGMEIVSLKQELSALKQEQVEKETVCASEVSQNEYLRNQIQELASALNSCQSK